jgi:hypothetical protein
MGERGDSFGCPDGGREPCETEEECIEREVREEMHLAVGGSFLCSNLPLRHSPRSRSSMRSYVSDSATVPRSESNG